MKLSSMCCPVWLTFRSGLHMEMGITREIDRTFLLTVFFLMQWNSKRWNPSPLCHQPSILLIHLPSPGLHLINLILFPYPCHLSPRHDETPEPKDMLMRLSTTYRVGTPLKEVQVGQWSRRHQYRILDSQSRKGP